MNTIVSRDNVEFRLPSKIINESQVWSKAFSEDWVGNKYKSDLSSDELKYLIRLLESDNMVDLLEGLRLEEVTSLRDLADEYMIPKILNIIDEILLDMLIKLHPNYKQRFINDIYVIFGALQSPTDTDDFVILDDMYFQTSDEAVDYFINSEVFDFNNFIKYSHEQIEDETGKEISELSEEELYNRSLELFREDFQYENYLFSIHHRNVENYLYRLVKLDKHSTN